MSVEKMVIEFFGRVKDLEEQNKELIARIERLERGNQTPHPTEQEDTEESEEVKITRSVTRKYVMDKLEKHNPMFKVTKGNRAIGADLVLTTTVKAITYNLKAKFYHSRSYEEGYPRSWHSVKKEDVLNEDINLHVFLIEHNGKCHVWIFNRLQLIQLCQKKETDQNGWYYFYFTIKDGKNYEARDGEYDVSEYYEQWDAPQKELRMK